MFAQIENHDQSHFFSWKPNIQNKTVVFVGDVNKVGHTTAVMLAAHGAPVFLAACSRVALKQAFADINRAGGECDGMVVDWNRPEECRRFFMLAEAWLGGIDAAITPVVEGSLAGQILCMQEAVLRMQAVGRGRIIHINLPCWDGWKNRLEQRQICALRQQAHELGILITQIEAGPAHINNPQDFASCVLECLAQPYSAEGIQLIGGMKANSANSTSHKKMLNKDFDSQDRGYR